MMLDYQEMSGATKFFYMLIVTISVFFLGGLLVMWLAWLLAPTFGFVGFSYWTSCFIAVVGRSVAQTFIHDYTKD